MSKIHSIYLVQNQDKLFLGKHDEWVDGRDPGCLFKTRHKDEALNQLFEVNSKDVHQRIHLVECDVAKSGQPVIDPAIMPPPLPVKEHRRTEEADKEEQTVAGNNLATQQRDANTTDGSASDQLEPQHERFATAE